MQNNEKIESILKSQGLSEYKWIDPKEIVVANWVRMKCTFGCNGYGGGACPPNVPSVKDCKDFFMEYEKGLILKFNITADKNEYPTDLSNEIAKKLLATEREIFLSGFQKTFLLGQSGCSFCNDCSNNRIDCIDKLNARPKPESFAVDVYKTARNIGYEINVIAESQAEITRIAILLIE